MKKYKTKEDIFIFGKKVLEKDTIIEISDETEFLIEREGLNLSLTIQDILTDNRFIEIKEEFKFDIKVITDDEEDEIRPYRIQLDVTTSRRKLRQVENHLRNTLEELL